MKSKLLFSLLSLLPFTFVFAETPSDLDRSEIKLQKGEIDLMQAYVKGAGAKGISKYSGGLDQGFSDFKLAVGTKLIAGKVDESGAIGFAIAPDINLHVRYDEQLNKMRLEFGGKLISALDFQVVGKGSLSSREIEDNKDIILNYTGRNQLFDESLKKNKDELEVIRKFESEVAKKDYVKDGKISVPANTELPKEDVRVLEEQLFLETKVCAPLIGQEGEICRQKLNNNIRESYSKILKRRMTFLEQDIALDERAKIENQKYITEAKNKLEEHKNKKPYATFDVSLANLGAEYKDLRDALYKFYGFKGSILRLSFDVAAKSGNVNVGLCGDFDLGRVTAGKYKSKEGQKATGTFGAKGSVCGKFGIGPVMLTNTFTAGIDGEPGRIESYSYIDNTARLGVISKTSVANTELNIHHSYTYEVAGGTKVESSMVGVGVIVAPK